MPINSRAKGAAGERELANYLKEKGYDTRRGMQFCGLNGDADVVGLPHIHIECKRVENLNLDKALEQAIRDTGDRPEFPCVFHRKNHTKWKVTMRLDDWLEIYKDYEKGEINEN